MLGSLEYLLGMHIILGPKDDARIGPDDALNQLNERVASLLGRGLGEHGWVRIDVEDGLEGFEEQGEAVDLPCGAWGVIEGDQADLGGHAGHLVVRVVDVVDARDVQAVHANLLIRVSEDHAVDESE